MTFCRRLFDQLPDRQSRSNPERWQGYLMIMKRAEVGFVSYSSKNSIFLFPCIHSLFTPESEDWEVDNGIRASQLSHLMA